MEAAAPPSSMSLPARLLKVFFSPGELFENLREKPVWGTALVAGGILAGLAVLLIPADIWVQAMRERVAEQGGELPPFLESASAAFRFATAAGGLVFWFVWAFLLAGILTFVFAFLLGDEGKYVQYLSIVGHGLFISAVGALLLLPLRLAQGDPSLTLNVGTFFPFLQDGYAARVLKLLDLFGLWSYAVMAVGVTKIHPRRGIGSALSFCWAFALVFAMVFGIFGG